MNLRRRQFIGILAASAGAVGAWAYFKTGVTANQNIVASPGLLLGGGKYIDPADGNAIRYVMASTRMDGAAPKLYPVHFFPHGIVVDPNNHQRLMLFQKKGPGACEINMQAGKMTRSLNPKQGCHFYGHGAFSTDGSVIYATETYLDSQQGTITIRDAKNLKILGEFPTHGANPHDCHLFDGGRQMAITNAGGNIGSGEAPAVTYVDVNNGQLLERIELGHQRINTGHLLLTSKLDLVVVSAPRDGLPTTNPGGVSMRPVGKEMKTMMEPGTVVDQMLGESLSVAVHEPSRTVAVTNPDANLITFWNLSEQRLISSLSIKKPRGVTLSLDKKYFVFSFGADTSMMLVPVDTLQPIKKSIVPRMYISGSHIINWDDEVRRLS